MRCSLRPLAAAAVALLQVMDYGYPQFTEAQILQEFIKTDSYRMEVRIEAVVAASQQQQQQQQQLCGHPLSCTAAAPAPVPSSSLHSFAAARDGWFDSLAHRWHCMQAVVKPPMAVTNAVSWRSEGIRWGVEVHAAAVHQSAGTCQRSSSVCTLQPAEDSHPVSCQPLCLSGC
jgi:hypothetical protein